MSKNRENRPSWFKLFLHQKALFDAVPDDVLGQAVKAALQYFTNKELPSLDPMSMVVFSAIKPYIDESFIDYERDVANGKKGGRPKKPPVTVGKGGLPYQTEAEAEAETDAEADIEVEDKQSAKPPVPSRKSYGAFGWVKLTDDQYFRLVSDLGETEAERCISYVDESAQTTGNKNRWKDWNLVVRKCSREGWGTRAGKAQSSNTSTLWQLARLYAAEELTE